MYDSMVFYRSFYEAIKDLDNDIQVEVYNAIFGYGLNGDIPNLSPMANAIFTLVKPQIDRSIKISDNKNGRHCAEYIKWRNDVFKRDRYTCQKCHKKGVKLNAHHIKEYAKYPFLRYDVDNGITLCEKCHKQIHRKKGDK